MLRHLLLEERREALRRLYLVAMAVVLGTTVLAFVALGAHAQGTDWQYHSAGDSITLPAGDAELRGYVSRYESYIEQDTGRSVDPPKRYFNNAILSAELLAWFQHPRVKQMLVAPSEIITFDAGAGEFLTYRGFYKANRCWDASLTDPEYCLKRMVAAYNANMSTTIAEIASAKEPNAIVRGMVYFNPHVATDKTQDTYPGDAGDDNEVLQSYLKQMNDHLKTELGTHGEAYGFVDFQTLFNGPNLDEDPIAKGLTTVADPLHPTSRGHKLLADEHRALGYSPLYP